MRNPMRPAFVLFLVLTVVTGVIYPAVVTLVARVFFPTRSAGSVIEHGDKAVGSELIGQPFTDVRYFWSRPSATSPVPYNGSTGSGSNQAPSNPALVKAVEERAAALKAANPNGGAVPVDLVTASGSGLDPHISPAAAQYQVARVAGARGMTPEAVSALIDEATEGRLLGVLGEPRVNVLKLNLALDRAVAR